MPARPCGRAGTPDHRQKVDAGADVVGSDSARRGSWECVSMDALLNTAETLRRLLERIALASGWLLVIMACVTTFDVVARKFGMALPYTKLQELEWHFHAAIFSL